MFTRRALRIPIQQGAPACDGPIRPHVETSEAQGPGMSTQAPALRSCCTEFEPDLDRLAVADRRRLARLRIAREFGRTDDGDGCRQSFGGDELLVQADRFLHG